MVASYVLFRQDHRQKKSSISRMCDKQHCSDDGLCTEVWTDVHRPMTEATDSQNLDMMEAERDPTIGGLKPVPEFSLFLSLRSFPVSMFQFMGGARISHHLASVLRTANGHVDSDLKLALTILHNIGCASPMCNDVFARHWLPKSDV